MYKFYLSSIGTKILAVIIFIAMAALCCVLIIFYNQVTLVAILFSCFVTLLCFCGCVLIFNHKIVINLTTGKFIVSSIKKQIININEIKTIAVNNNLSVNPKKYCNLEISLLDGSMIRVSGYFSIIKKSDVQKTRNIVYSLNTLLFERS